MKISTIQPNTFFHRATSRSTDNSFNATKKLQIPQHPDFNKFSYYCTPPVFKGVWFEDSIVKKVTDKEFYGLGIYNNNFIDFNKIGWANLSKEPFDIVSATDNEVLAFQHALALGETVDTSWVQRFNPFNVDLPLATNHTLCDRASKKVYSDNLKILTDTSKNPELDSPVFNKKGKLILDCVVWDTETTGVNATNKNIPLDKIVQIGSIQIKKGATENNTAYKQLINPQIPIPENSSMVHGIYDADVQNMPTMNEVLPEYLIKHLNKKNGTIVAYNSKFDMAMLNNSINDFNKTAQRKISQKPTYNVIDPFILTQRIHPFVGAKKKLGEQYKYLFCKNLDDAHDAFADVKGTVDVLKYDLYYLNNHRKDKSIPLTLRDVLLFQNGLKPDNLDISLNHLGCNASVNFKMSYRLKPLNVMNYFKGYKLKEENLPEMEPVIGTENVKKLKNIIIPDGLSSETDEGLQDIDAVSNNNSQPKKRTVFYTQNRNFKKILKFADIQEFNGLTKTEVFDYITEKSKNYVNNKSIDLIYKNTNPRDIKYGNDMPDFKISRRVMLEKSKENTTIE